MNKLCGRQKTINMVPLLLGLIVFFLGWQAGTLLVCADHTPNPSSVTVVGSLQSELGCPGDWQPDCSVTHLGFDVDDTVWQGVFNIPAGNWEYKAALNDSWDENYGAGAVQNGANIGLSLSDPTDVKFYYAHKTHWITDNVNSIIATAPGNFQSEMGCPGDWQPDCLRSWLQDPDGDGMYNFSTNAIPAGNYEAKVAINESWDENYGAGGVQNGPNIPFSVPADAIVYFVYDSVTHVLQIAVAPTPDIKANGSDGPLAISKAAENLVITISLDPGGYAGTYADWWVRALRQSNGDTWWYTKGTGWVKSATPIRAYGGKLRSVAPLEVWNGSIPVDIWLFHFAVDTNMNNVG